MFPTGGHGAHHAELYGRLHGHLLAGRDPYESRNSENSARIARTVVVGGMVIAQVSTVASGGISKSRWPTRQPAIWLRRPQLREERCGGPGEGVVSTESHRKEPSGRLRMARRAATVSRPTVLRPSSGRAAPTPRSGLGQGVDRRS